MKSHLIAVLASVTLVAMGGASMAHHSFAMFDQANPIDLVGVVMDWRYTAPHVFIAHPIEVGGSRGDHLIGETGARRRLE